MAINISQRCGFPTEASVSMDGTTKLVAVLEFNPVLIIFDNQSSASVAIYVNQTTDVWRTFTPNECLVLDLRAAHGVAPNFTMDKKTTFFGNGASGTFSISYIYALEP